MTTSGQTSFSQTRDEIITDALCLLGVYGQGDTVSPADISFCSNILNKMLKAWEGQGIHLWTQQEGSIFLAQNQQVYEISEGSVDMAGDAPIFNTLTSSGTGSSLNVLNTKGITVGDYLGVVLDSGVIQWTTVSSIPSINQLVMTASLESSSSAGNNVFTFTNQIDRPLDIVSCRYRAAGGYERPIPLMGRAQFMATPLKTQTGPGNQAYYAPQVSSALFYTWPVCINPNECYNISYLRRIQDLDSSTDTPDLPQEWLDAITTNLAWKASPAYGIALSKVNPDLVAQAKEALMEMQLWDAEEGGLMVVPNYRWDCEN